eukprot:9173935-Pyramimonas_sp.AAC.1
MDPLTPLAIEALIRHRWKPLEHPCGSIGTHILWGRHGSHCHAQRAHAYTQGVHCHAYGAIAIPQETLTIPKECMVRPTDPAGIPSYSEGGGTDRATHRKQAQRGKH